MLAEDRSIPSRLGALLDEDAQVAHNGFHRFCLSLQLGAGGGTFFGRGRGGLGHHFQ